MSSETPPIVFEVERDVAGGGLEIAVTTFVELKARAEYARRDSTWRLVSYPLGNKRELTQLSPTPASSVATGPC